MKMVGMNRNMRCIEILTSMGQSIAADGMNRNMRCIEIPTLK